MLIWGLVPFFMYNRPAQAWPRIRSFFEAVQHDEAHTLPVGAAGFCWGGQPVLTLTHPGVVSKDGRQLVDAVFTGHPSALSLPGDVDKITKPVSVAIGDKDKVTPMKQVKLIQDTWARIGNDVATEVVVYPGAGHGFCVRVDPRNENQFQQSKDAEVQAVAWFQRHLRASTI